VSSFHVTRVGVAISGAAATQVADFPAIENVDRAFLFPACYPHSTAGIGRTTGSLSNTLRSVTATAQITTVDDITFNDYNDSSLNNNLCATWLLTYLGPAGGPDEIVNRGSFSLTVADGASTVDSAAISGIVDATKLVPLFYAAGEHNSADYRSHCPRIDIVNTGGSTYVVRVTRQNTSGALNVVGRVAEFTGSKWSVEKVTHTFTASATNEDETITSVDPATAFTVSYMMHTDANQPTRQMYHVWLHDGTTLRHRIKTKPTTNPVVTSWVISHPNLAVTRYGTPDGTSDVVGSGATPEAANIDITAVSDLDQAMVIGYMGSDTALTTTAPCGLRSFEFADADTITARRSDGLGDSEYVLQVIDFSGVQSTRIDSVSIILEGGDFTISGVFDANPVVTHNGEAVTVNSSDSTTINCTASLGTKRYGEPYPLSVVDDSGVEAVSDEPIYAAAGTSYVNLYEPLVVASQRPTTSPMDLDEAVDTYGSVQMRWRNVGGEGMTQSDFSVPSSGNARYRPEATSVELSVHDTEWSDWETQALELYQPRSVLSRVVVDIDTTLPSTPSLGSVAVLSSSSLRVTWSASTDTGGSGLAGYRVRRSATSGGTYSQVGSDLTTASLSFDDAGLSAGTTYYYRVYSFDGAGNESLASNTGFNTTSAALSSNSVLIDTNTPGAYRYGRLTTTPSTFGSGEFTIGIWFKATNTSTTAALSDATIGTAAQRTSWQSSVLTKYASSSWWYHVNFLLDGHNNNNYHNGTLSLGFMGGGRPVWLFGDGSAAQARSGGLHAVTATSSAFNVLDGNWHYIEFVRSNTGASSSLLTGRMDGVVFGTETSTARTDMRTYWNSFTGYPTNQNGFFFFAEKQAAINLPGVPQWSNAKGYLGSVRLWSRAISDTDAADQYNDIISGTETGLVSWYRFNEGASTFAQNNQATGQAITFSNPGSSLWSTDGPTLESPSGSFAHGDTVAITGSGFGTHARNFGYLGTTIEATAAGAEIGTLSGWNLDGGSVGGVRSEKRGYDDSVRGRVLSSTYSSGFPDAALTRDTGASVGLGETVYITYWVYLTGLNNFSSGQVKLIRFRVNDDVVDNTPDVYLSISNHNGGAFAVQPNPSSGHTASNNYSSPIAQNGWYRVEKILVYPSTQGSSTGQALIRVHNGSGVPSNLSFSHSSGATNTNINLYPSSSRSRYCLFQGYFGNGITAGTLRQDDHYVQVGTRKRVELCNNATYASSTRREIQPLSAWSDTSVSVTLNKGGFTAGTYYLHVIGESDTSLGSREVVVL
jgi:hypothetical protein